MDSANALRVLYDRNHHIAPLPEVQPSTSEKRSQNARMYSPEVNHCMIRSGTYFIPVLVAVILL